MSVMENKSLLIAIRMTLKETLSSASCTFYVGKIAQIMLFKSV